jgi:peptidoglycan/xylan/chitin deacetylase (PgdA/CDA1 family)
MRKPRALLALLLAIFAVPLFAADTRVATVLSYHEVEPGGEPPHGTRPRRGADANSRDEQVRFTVSTDAFAQQLDYLTSNGFTVIPLNDLIDYLKGRTQSLPPKAVVITVDDGWLCTYTQMYPIMKKRKLPFTAFVYPAIIGHGGHYMTWQQVEQMSRDGVDIQSHSYTHSFLTLKNNGTITPDTYPSFLKHELLDTKNEIEQHTHKTVHSIAFPYSDYDETVIDAAAQYGYDAAVYDREQNAFVTRDALPMRIRRAPVRHDTTMEQFKAYVGN